MTITDWIPPISALIAAFTFAHGVSAWRREFVGKRRIELAESVLALFYETEDAIRELRSPFSWGGEGQSRKRSDRETPADSELFDRAYVLVERYRSREKLFAELRAIKYRVMSTFGRTASAPFDDIASIVNQLLTTSRMIGHQWRQQGKAMNMNSEQRERHFAIMEQYEAIFWDNGAEDDAVRARVKAAVGHIEGIARSESALSTARNDAPRE